MSQSVSGNFFRTTRTFFSQAKQLKKPVRGTVLVTDIHNSKSDPIPHYTVDCHTDGDDPSGTLHVYQGFKTFTAYAEVRAKAKANALLKAKEENSDVVDSVDQ